MVSSGLQTSPRFRTLKARAQAAFEERRLRRSGESEIHERLRVLLEKLRVLDNDPLANALQKRLKELDEKGSRPSFISDVLSLLLELSHRPEYRQNFDDLDALLSRPEPPKSLTWSEIYAIDPPNDEEAAIWETIDYAASSSDEDMDNLSSDDFDTSSDEMAHKTREKRIFPRTKENSKEYVLATSESGGLDQIVNDQLTTNRHTHFASRESSRDVYLTENQVCNEILIRLRGQPSYLFKEMDNDGVPMAPFYRLPHVSLTVFLSLLKTLGDVGSQLDILRTFTNLEQTSLHMKAFQLELKSRLSKFDAYLSSFEATIAMNSNEAAMTLTRFSYEVKSETQFLLDLSLLVQRLRGDFHDDALCLDLFYDLLCSKQASGQEEVYLRLVPIFFTCLMAYMQPIRLWMETGQLSAQSDNFFISELPHSDDPKMLWSRWFALKQSSGQRPLPKFLRFAARKIFITGKSALFLRKLNVSLNPSSPTSPSQISFDQIFPSAPELDILPFPPLLHSALRTSVDLNHDYLSSKLRQHLIEDCGLWSSLDALDYLYTSKDISRSSHIDEEVFLAIDRNVSSWNDRVSLRNLFQDVFDSSPYVDSSRIVLHSKKMSSELFENNSRSVVMIRAMTFDYILPWPVANVVLAESISVYRRIATFLMQIRWAKYEIDTVQIGKLEQDDKRSCVLTFNMRHSLLWFLNTLYAHLVGVIVLETTTMREALAKAENVDAMMAAHLSFTKSLEFQCLLSNETSVIHQTFVYCIDICIHFADSVSSRYPQARFETRSPPKDPPGRGSRPQWQNDFVEDSFEYDERMFAGNKLADEIPIRNASMVGNPRYYRKYLMDIKKRFDKVCAFIISDVRTQSSLNSCRTLGLLADKLDWRNRPLR